MAHLTGTNYNAAMALRDAHSTVSVVILDGSEVFVGWNKELWDEDTWAGLDDLLRGFASEADFRQTCQPCGKRNSSGVWVRA